MGLVSTESESGRSAHETSNGISYRSDSRVVDGGDFGCGSADCVVAHRSMDSCGLNADGHLRSRTQICTVSGGQSSACDPILMW